MFAPGSRYARVGQATVIDAQGRPRPYVLLRTFPPDAAAVQTHTFAAGERLDLIAASAYGDPGQFWRICDANRAVRPDDLEHPGLRLSIPIVLS